MDTNAEFKSETSHVVTLQECKEEDVESRGRLRQEPLLERFINFPSSIGFQTIVQVAWETAAVTFQFSLLNGGPASMVYGAILAGFGASAVGLSLAEMASIDPIVGAQYRWSASFAPFAPRFWGLIQGWITVSAWLFTAAAGPAIVASILSAMIRFNHPNVDLKSWHQAMIMWLLILLPVVFNLFFRKVLNTLEMIAAILHVVFFIATIATLSAMAQRSTTDFVFKTLFTGVSGWTNPGVSFGIGLLTVVYPLAGADGVLHMSAEVKRVRTRAPYSIIASVVSNAIMQFAFLVCLMFTIGDVQTVTDTPTGMPMIEVYYLTTKSVAGTNIFICAIFLIGLVSIFNTFASVSRLTWAFARDSGLPFSKTLSKIHPKFRMPFNSLCLMMVVCFILSLIYIGSSTAFSAIVSLTAIGLNSSYILPITFILIKKIRGQPLEFGPFALGKWGIPINVFSLMYLIYVIIWMPFPTMLPVTGSNMNYAGPILLFVAFAAIADWMLGGHKRFEIPEASRIPE